MLRKSIFGQENTWISKSIVTGAIVGGVFGAVAGFLYNTDPSAIPGVGFIFEDSPVNSITTGTVLGIFIGASINIMIGLYSTRDKTLKDDLNLNNSRLQLREEQLDISKVWAQTGEVIVRKEVLKEGKNIVVPTIREELVIEKKVLDTEASNKINERTEIIRIPISEERIEVIKHTVVHEDVEIYRHKLQKTEHIEEILKKEKLHMKTTGDPEIINKDT